MMMDEANPSVDNKMNEETQPCLDSSEIVNDSNECKSECVVENGATEMNNATCEVNDSVELIEDDLRLCEVTEECNNLRLVDDVEENHEEEVRYYYYLYFIYIT